MKHKEPSAQPDQSHCRDRSSFHTAQTHRAHRPHHPDTTAAMMGKFGPFSWVEAGALGDLVVYDDERRVAFGFDGRLQIELDADMGGDVIHEIRKQGI